MSTIISCRKHIMNISDALEFETRKEIYNFILEYPGLHLRELFRRLNHSGGAIKYHLNFLKKQHLIIEKHEMGYNRFYASNDVGMGEVKILNVLRQKNLRHILLYLLSCTGASQIELSRELNKDPKTIAFHLKKLKEYDIIEVAPVENGMVRTRYKKSKLFGRNPVASEVIYRLRDPYLAYNVFLMYKGKLFDENTTSDLIELFEFFFTKKRHKIITSSKTSMDNIEELLYDILPHPYHC